MNLLWSEWIAECEAIVRKIAFMFPRVQLVATKEGIYVQSRVTALVVRISVASLLSEGNTVQAMVANSGAPADIAGLRVHALANVDVLAAVDTIMGELSRVLVWHGSRPCAYCSGRGHNRGTPCDKCDGTGKINEKE